jgi:hypothetical protein
VLPIRIVGSVSLVALILAGTVMATRAALRVSAATATISVTGDASSYGPGDPITVTVVNGTPTPIAPLGGIVCQGSPWPFGVQRLDDAGEWQDVVFARTPPCIGIAVALFGPGESQTRQIAAEADPGTYRVTYAYDTTDGSGPGLAVSDPYDVDAASMASGPPEGYLEGQGSIGPLQPVERAGVPPTPSPAVCTARGLVVYDVNTGAEVARFALGPDCHYQVALPPGTYRVELDRRGIDFSKDLPRVVQITAGQSTRLDLSIDTGIR